MRRYLSAHRKKSLERLRKGLIWCERDLKKQIDEIVDGHYDKDYACQKREDALRLYESLVCVDAIRVKTDMQLKDTGVHRITKPPELRVIKDNEPGYWIGENREESVYFYHLEVES